MRKTKTWFEVLLRRSAEWIPQSLEEVTEDRYHTSDFFVPKEQFDDSLRQLLQFVSQDGLGLPRNIDYYDLLHGCEVRDAEHGTRVLCANTYLIIPVETIKKVRSASSARIICSPPMREMGSALVHLPNILRMSGRLECFKQPK